MAFDNLLVQREETVCTITLNRPSQRNALNTATVIELRRALAEARDDETVRVIVITGAGSIFCAGADLKGFVDERPALDAYAERGQLGDLFNDMTRLGKPTIARVNGHALAAGLGLCVACDLAIAGDQAEFAMPEVQVGVFPMMVMATIFRNVPRKVGMELMLTGKRVSAAEAARVGLINRAVAPDRLDAEVDALATELSSKSPIGMRLGLEAFYRSQDMPYPAALAYLQDQLALLALSDDLKEGVNAFFEKREPRFTGR